MKRENKLKVAFVRGAYLNMFEGQNYIFNNKIIDFQAYAAYESLHESFPFSVVRLFSLSDINVPKAITNRILGDGQKLLGLEKKVVNFDIVHTADPHYYYSYQLARMRKAKKIPYLLSTSWETIPFNNESVYMKKRIKRFTLQYIDRFICYTKRAKESLIKQGIEASKISVIPLGVDINRFKPLRTKRKKVITILFVGRLVKEKGILDLIQAYEKVLDLVESHKKVRLRIIGTGPLLDKAKKYNVEQIEYDKMHKVYQEADIFVLPSQTTNTWEEQYGMVLIEAMASGLPIVAYRSGSISELLRSKEQTVKEGDVKALSKIMYDLCTNEKKRLRLGKINRERAVKYFDAKKTSAQIMRLYQQIGKRISHAKSER